MNRHGGNVGHIRGLFQQTLFPLAQEGKMFEIVMQ